MPVSSEPQPHGRFRLRLMLLGLLLGMLLGLLVAGVIGRLVDQTPKEPDK